MRRAIIATSLAALISGVPSTPAQASTATPGSSYQVDVAHDGNARDVGVSYPLEEAWHRHWAGTLAYPVIADGIVFVTVNDIPGSSEQLLLALDADDGSTVWRTTNVENRIIGLTADGGRLFTISYGGLLSAYDTTTGSLAWSAVLPFQYSFTSPPTANDGVVYIGGSGSGGTVYAVDETTGDLLWTQSVANGDHSAPTLTPYGVVVGYACYQVYDLLPADGSVVWHHSTGCSGGGGRTTVYYGDRVYANDDAAAGGYILDASSGAEVGTFTASSLPAFSGTSGYFPERGTLRARVLSTMQARWSFAGDGHLVSQPLVVGGRVLIASSPGRLYVLRTNTGRRTHAFNLGAPYLAPDEHNAVPVTGMNAGEGLVLVPASGRLLAFR